MEYSDTQVNSHHSSDKNFLDLVKKILLKNNFVLAFSSISIISLLIALLNFSGVQTGIALFSTIISLFAGYIWLFLAISFALSSVLAYYEKYNWMFIPLLVWLLFTTAAIRTSNMPFLKNAATGESELGPDLDTYLFVRNAQEISEGRNLGELDMMRGAPLGGPSYIKGNLMPWLIFFVFKIINLFGGEHSITYAGIIAPVIFFLISIIGFFLFSFVIFSFKFSKEQSLVVASIGSFLYAFIPSMLHRTMAGIPELESLGMVWFWFAFLFFALAWKQELKQGISNNKKMIVYGLLAGLFTGLMSWTWGGYKYIYMILSLTTFLCLFFNIEQRKNFLIFTSFLISGIFLELLKIKNISGVVLSISDTGFSLAIFALMIINLIISKERVSKRLWIDKINLPAILKSIILLAIISILGLVIFKPALLSGLFADIVERLLYPFGRGRIGVTVAENRAPYFSEVFGAFGYLFWFFFFSAIFLFYNSTKHFDTRKKSSFNVLFLIFLVSFIFSRISPSHQILNGETIISKTLYFGGFLIFSLFFAGAYVKASMKKDEKVLKDFSRIGFSYLLFFSFSFWAIVSMRGAIRLFFIIAPILALISPYILMNLYEKASARKDASRKIFLTFLAILILISASFSIRFINETSITAKNIVPSVYNQQWHHAMNWVEQNTPENSIFVFWWDYGYWVQSLGKRPTDTDGGHANSWWDHTTARYLLTTSEPETALSLMKTHNVSYLLIDSTDLGKYPAFSSIGSDATGKDRRSWIPVMPSNPAQTQETKDGEVRIYQGGFYLDKDILYEENGERIFLPEENAAVLGALLEYSRGGENLAFAQPHIAFNYNGQRQDLPIRYLYFRGEMFDFESGVNITLMLIPALVQGQQGIQVDDLGATIFLSEKTMNSLFAELYLMDDPFNKYPTIKLAHSQDDFIIESLRSQGLNIGEFVFYQGFRGPIKIWDTQEIPEDIFAREEFLQNIDATGNWASLDDLEFTK